MSNGRHTVVACCYHCSTKNQFEIAATFHRAKAIYVCCGCRKANNFSMESTPLNAELDVHLQNGKAV